MILLFHIVTAFGSLIAAGAAYSAPSQYKLHTTYFLTTSMFLSGTLLVIRNTAHLLEACIMGLALLAVIAYATISARAKLARQISGNE